MNKKINFIPAVSIILLCSLIVGSVVVLITFQMKDFIKVSSFEKQKKEREEGVILVTDKTEYNKGEEVKVTVKNNLDEEIEFYGVGVEKSFKFAASPSLEWEEDVRYDIECPCMADCEKMIDIVSPKSTKEYSWDQIDDVCQQVKEGKYRFRADWRELGVVYGKSPPPVHSNEFIIK